MQKKEKCRIPINIGLLYDVEREEYLRKLLLLRFIKEAIKWER